MRHPGKATITEHSSEIADCIRVSVPWQIMVQMSLTIQIPLIFVKTFSLMQNKRAMMALDCSPELRIAVKVMVSIA